MSTQDYPDVVLPDTPPLPGKAQSYAPGESLKTLGADDPTIKDVTGKLTDLDLKTKDALKSGENQYDKALKDYNTIAKQHLEAEGVEAKNLPKWNEKQEEEKFHTDPVMAFGSLGSVFGILASAFTRAPMENALNASAAAIDAVNQGNNEGYKRANAAYKQNLELAYKRHELEHQDYEDAATLMKTNMEAGQNKLRMAMTKYGFQQGRILHEAGMDDKLFEAIAAKNKAMEGAYEASQKITLEGLQKRQLDVMLKNNEQIKDPMKRAAADNAAAHTIYGAKTTAEQEAMGVMTAEMLAKGKVPTADDYAKVHQKFQRPLNTEQDIIKNLYDQHEAAGQPPPTSEEIAEAISTFRRKSAKPGAAGSTNLTIDRQNAKSADSYADELRKKNPEMSEDEISEKRAERYKELKQKSTPITANKADELQGKIDQADNIIRMSEKNLDFLSKYKGGAGLMGKIMRGEEILGNITGAGNESDREQFRRNVLELQTIVPQILTDRTGRPIASAQAKIDGVVAGLEAGDTTPNTIRAYRELIEDIKKRQSDYRSRKGGASESPAPEKSIKTPSWQDAPLVGGQ